MKGRHCGAHHAGQHAVQLRLRTVLLLYVYKDLLKVLMLALNQQTASFSRTLTSILKIMKENDI